MISYYIYNVFNVVRLKICKLYFINMVCTQKKYGRDRNRTNSFLYRTPK